MGQRWVRLPCLQVIVTEDCAVEVRSSDADPEVADMNGVLLFSEQLMKETGFLIGRQLVDKDGTSSRQCIAKTVNRLKRLCRIHINDRVQPHLFSKLQRRLLL